MDGRERDASGRPGVDRDRRTTPHRERRRGEATVYNFRVEEWHTYFVGDPITWGFDVWVHNTHVAQASTGGDSVIKRGAGGGVKHESHGKGSENSGAAQNRKADKQKKFARAQALEKDALDTAKTTLAALKEKLGKNFKLVLGNMTEEQWLRAEQLKILNP